MFDNLLDNFRKASESSLQMQQEMMKQWTQQWTSGQSNAASQPADWGKTLQKRWVDLGVELLSKHRQSIDSMYASAIQLIEQAFRSSDVKSPDEYRHVVEDLCRKLFDTFKAQSENQFRDFQTWSERSAEMVQDVRS